MEAWWAQVEYLTARGRQVGGHLRPHRLDFPLSQRPLILSSARPRALSPEKGTQTLSPNTISFMPRRKLVRAVLSRWSGAAPTRE